MPATLNESYPDRFPLSPTLADHAEGKDEIVVVEERRRTVEQITQQVLEAVADEIGHLLAEGVVAEPAGDACLILGAGWPFFLGGITPYLRDEGNTDADIGIPAESVML